MENRQVVDLLERLRAVCPYHSEDEQTRGVRAMLVKKMAQHDVSASSLDRWRKGENTMRSIYVTTMDEIISEVEKELTHE